MFIQPKTETDTKTNLKNIPLFACHADGYVRIWDHTNGQLIQETDGQNGYEEGMSCMAVNPEATLLFVGGSKGSIRVYSTILLLFI